MEAAELMKITSHELLNMEIVDKVIPEHGFSNGELLAQVKKELQGRVKGFTSLTSRRASEQRYQRFRILKTELAICKSQFFKLYFGAMTSAPPIYGRRTSGMVTEPSSF